MKYLINNRLFNPIKVGDPGDFYEDDEDTVCGDCGAKYGEQHLAGCDCERCPLCGLQLISCGHIVYEVNEEIEPKEGKEMT